MEMQFIWSPGRGRSRSSREQPRSTPYGVLPAPSRLSPCRSSTVLSEATREESLARTPAPDADALQPGRGYLHPYPTPDLLTADPEEEELNLLYRNVPTFALGHGAAAQWDLTSGSEPSSAEIAFIPRAVVPGVQFERSDIGEVLGLGFLAGIQERPIEAVQVLRGFVAEYSRWHMAPVSAAASLPEQHREAGGRLVDRIEEAATRMGSGVDLIERIPMCAAHSQRQTAPC